jgi:hypothetical protein
LGGGGGPFLGSCRNFGGYDDAAVEGAFSPTENDEGNGDARTTPQFPHRRRRMVRMIPRCLLERSTESALVAELVPPGAVTEKS